MMRRLILLALVTLGACSGRMERDEVPGSYEFMLDGLRQVVVIGGDGRYANTLYKEGVAVWVDQQPWTYEAEKGGVTFTGFRFGIPGYASSPGLWFVVPRKAFGGNKELCFDADLGRCFSTK